MFTFIDKRELRVAALGERHVWPIVQATDARVQFVLQSGSWTNGRIKVRYSNDGHNFVDGAEFSSAGASDQLDVRSWAYIAVEVTTANGSDAVVEASICAKGAVYRGA